MTAPYVDEYEQCQRRGHEPSGLSTTEGFGVTWNHCRWCNVRFRTEERVVEHDADVVALYRGAAIPATGDAP